MKFTKEQDSFINNYVKALKEKNAVVFAGAGLSAATGVFDWKGLLKPIAERLDLDIEHEERDLTALAQFFVDNQGGVRGELNQILVEQYGKLDLKPSLNHEILARLPIQIYWTTNYDRNIEEALKKQNKTPDVKRSEKDLAINFPKRDAIVYKMHGDIDSVSDTVLTKHEYEDYNETRELFSNAFKSDYVARTFLFVGFSFTDPNLDYLISRIRTTLRDNVKPDYFFIKVDSDSSKQKRQVLRSNSLKRYGLIAIWIDNYNEITKILHEIEIRYLRNTILISGSAKDFGEFGMERAGAFLHDLSKELSFRNFKIVSGFGDGVGSPVINGVLDNMINQRNQNLDEYLILRPFPQYATGAVSLKELWTNYRKNFIPLAGVAIFSFGNKASKDSKEIISANGLLEEFEIAKEIGLQLLPVGATGFLSKELWEKVYSEYEKYFPNHSDLKKHFEIIGEPSNTNEDIIKAIITIISKLNIT